MNSVPGGILAEHEGLGDIVITTTRIIVVAPAGNKGIYGRKNNGGDSDITITSTGDTITTGNGFQDHGIFAAHQVGDGEVSITVKDGTITTNGNQGHGIAGWQWNNGNVKIKVTGGSITSNGTLSRGISGLIEETSSGSSGNIDIEATEVTITATDYGIHGQNKGSSGNIKIKVTGGSIESSKGIRGTIETTGNGDIDIEATEVTITTTSHGIHGSNYGSGNVKITSGSSITTTGSGAFGIYGWINSTSSDGDITLRFTGGSIETMDTESYGIVGYNQGTGDVSIDMSDGTITTNGSNAYGIYGLHQGTGNVSIDMSGGRITTTGSGAHGILGRINSTSSDGDITLRFTGGSIETKGTTSHGIYGLHRGTGNVSIDMSGGRITTTGSSAHGILGRIESPTNDNDITLRFTGGSIETMDTESYGIYGLHQGTGDVSIDMSGGRIITTGSSAFGIYGWINSTSSDGDITLRFTGGSIETKGTTSHGIVGDNQGTGDVSIDMSDGTITTNGSNAYGIYGLHRGTGNVSIDMSGGRITTTGSGAHGILGWINSTSSDGDITLRFTGGSIETSGTESHGILVYNQGTGDVSIDMSGGTITAGGLNAHGIYSRTASGSSTVRIDGRVMGGTGTGAGVYISGGGSVIIGPDGFVGSESGTAIGSADELTVNLLSNDGKPWKRLGGRFINNSGDTTLAVNGVDLYQNGVLDSWASSGFHQVRLNSLYDFSTLDFSRKEAWLSRYGVNAGLYESLPGAIRRIHTFPCRFSSNRRVAIDICGGRGKYTPDRSDTGMKYTYDQRAIQAHLKGPLSDRLTGWVGGRVVNGEAEVTTTVGRGRLKVSGPGLYGGVHLELDNNYYGEARVSWYRYDAEMSARVTGDDDAEPITANADGNAYSLEIEGGRHFTLNNGMQLTGRGWYHLAKASVNSFRDSLNTLVSAEDKQVKVGLGLNLVRKRALVRENRFLVLRGGVGLEHVVSDDSKATTVGATINNTAKDNRLLLDVRGEYHRENLEIHGEVFAYGLVADDTVFGLKVGMNWSF